MLLVFDTETTGLTLHPQAELRRQPRVIELGGVLLQDGVVVHRESWLIDPGEPITDEITKITGITTDMVRGQGSFIMHAEQMAAMFGRATSMVSHNLPFDRALIVFELRRYNITGWPWPKGEYCTVGMHREEWGRNPKLTELYEATTGKKFAQTHRALGDVDALVEIIQKAELWRYMK